MLRGIDFIGSTVRSHYGLFEKTLQKLTIIAEGKGL